MDKNDFVNCLKCGEIISQKDNFCKYCGQRNQESERDHAVFDTIL